jgi:NADPH:quinone reductase-like Zn-dependent oxidoreductase
MTEARSANQAHRKDRERDYAVTPDPKTMMALRAHRRGGPEQLIYESAPRPVPNAGEALIEVHAAAITFTELSWDETWRAPDGADRTPIIPSHEVSGVVAELGNETRGLAIGDEVYALITFNRDGAAAEYVTVPAAHLVDRPRSITHVEAAAVPLAALTAWQALVDHAAIQVGDRVLVRGAAGGVGSFAVQLAAQLGAHVTAIARTDDADFVRSLGAEQVFEASSDARSVAIPKVDVVIDAGGGEVTPAMYGMLPKGGRLVTLSAPPSSEEAARHGVTATFFIVSPNAGQLRHLADLVDTGRLRPVVAQTFPLSAGRDAYESGPCVHRPGKTVLVVR